MDDLSEPLKRIYRYLDSLKAVAKNPKAAEIAAELNTIESGIRGYTDNIAESVDYTPEE